MRENNHDAISWSLIIYVNMRAERIKLLGGNREEYPNELHLLLHTHKNGKNCPMIITLGKDLEQLELFYTTDGIVK